MITRIEKYSATWCGPCQVLKKTLHDVLEDYPDIELEEYDADDNEEKFEEMGIRNVPVMFFYNEEGHNVHGAHGAISANKIKEILDYHNGVKETYNSDLK